MSVSLIGEITDSWATISSRSANGANYYSVGDYKKIKLNGTVGTLSLSNLEVYVYILGFNHNSSIEGNGITFGCFKMGSGASTDVCLVGDDFCINTTNTSTGGWKACNMRYNILGSTKTSNGDASTTTATSPKSNTLMSCLPSDLRAVMKPITKYTDNVGANTEHDSDVTSSVDYLPLLAEFEISGSRKYANNAEQNYQKQYAYYSAGNSILKYEHSNIYTASYWWLRSYYPLGTDKQFCCVNVYNMVFHTRVGSSCGLAPIFKV